MRRVTKLLCVCAFAIATLRAQVPIVEDLGITNAASFLSLKTPTVVPQMLVSIFGENLSTKSASAASSQLPDQLDGTSVTFNGIRARLLYVSPNQINLEVPSALVGASSAQMVIASATGKGNSVTVAVGSFSPGIFTQNGSGCGQAIAYNIQSDGKVTRNTTGRSFDPLKDTGLMIYLTGVGAFADQTDGTPAVFRATDDVSAHLTAHLGNIAVSSYQSQLAVSYAGPAAGLVGADQVRLTAAASPVPQGCRVPLSILSDSSPNGTQYVNVSIHNGGGACVDPPADTMALVAWQRTVVSDAVEPSSTDGVSVRFLQGSAIGFQAPMQAGDSYLSDHLPAQPVDACRASTATSVDAGPIIVTQPGATGVTLKAQPEDGQMTYPPATLTGSIHGGVYQISGSGKGFVGPFTGTMEIAAPIQITNQLKPGAELPADFVLNWTGGEITGVVTVQYQLQSASGANVVDIKTVPATAGSLKIGSGGAGVVNLTVTHQSTAPQTFTAPGLTLGGQQSWKYQFIFNGLAKPAI